MYKYNEKYILSLNDKDKGKVTILGIADKRNSKFKKRLHKNKRVYQVKSY